jgi:thioester reductase-like protein
MYGLADPSHSVRLAALAGDVGKVRFGLAMETYQTLTGRTVCVVHNAAVVTSALPYAALKNANVDGTAHAIRLAAAAGAPLHHISTIGLLAGSGVLEERAEVPPVALALLSGYAQSKWVAERLVLHSRIRHGIRARLYRAGTLAGHSETGACNMHDTVTRLLLGLRREKICALADDSPLPRSFPLIASDWAAAAVARLSGVQLGNPAEELEDEAVMHVVSRTPQSLEDLVDAIEAAGTPLARVSGEEFRDRIAAIGEAHPLFAFKTVLSGTGYASAAAGALPEDKRLRSQLKGISPACPRFNAAMLVRTIQWAAQRETEA